MQTGLGIRPEIVAAVEKQRPALGFLEAHSENYFGDSILRAKLVGLRCDYEISLHGVGLSLGRADGLDKNHLRDLKFLVDELEPILVSEHLAWSAYSHRHLPDLLPLPLTGQSLSLMCAHIDQMQEALQRQVLIENPSNYLAFDQLLIPEPEFLNILAERTGCGLLVDVNNVHVSAVNLGRDANDYIKLLNSDAIGQYHLAGYTEVNRDGECLLIDTHNHTVYPSVWQLFEQTVMRHGARPTLIEWDSDFPELSVLLGECAQADRILASTSVSEPVTPQAGQSQTVRNPTAELANYQQSFLDKVLAGSSELPQAVASHRHRIWVYQNNVLAATREYLQEVYPAVSGVVGAAFFQQMAQVFVQNQPPVEGNIHRYGQEFAMVLPEFDALSELPYLTDLIDYEWALHTAYFSSVSGCLDASGISRDELLSIPVRFNPSVSLLESRYPLFEIHRQSIPQYTGKVEIDLAQSQDALLIFKQEFAVVTRLLSRDELVFLSAMQSKDNLLQSIESVQGSLPVQSLTEIMALLFKLNLLMAA